MWGARINARTIDGQGCLTCARKAQLERTRAVNAKRERGKRALARNAGAAASVQPRPADDPVTAEPDLFDSDEFLKLPPTARAVKDDPDLPF